MQLPRLSHPHTLHPDLGSSQALETLTTLYPKEPCWELLPLAGRILHPDVELLSSPSLGVTIRTWAMCVHPEKRGSARTPKSPLSTSQCHDGHE